MRPRFWCKPTSKTTKLLLTRGGDELLRALLPSPIHHRAPSMLVDALAHWLGQPISVALSVGGRVDLSDHVLYDDALFGASSVHYEVELVGRHEQRRLASKAAR